MFIILLSLKSDIFVSFKILKTKLIFSQSELKVLMFIVFLKNQGHIGPLSVMITTAVPLGTEHDVSG
jgi:hypothetical protein